MGQTDFGRKNTQEKQSKQQLDHSSSHEIIEVNRRLTSSLRSVEQHRRFHMLRREDFKWDAA
jgi:hypothetical protein